MGAHCIEGKGMTFFTESEITLADFEEYFDIPYADILEMPTKILLNPHV
jgi:hypothetical protein